METTYHGPMETSNRQLKIRSPRKLRRDLRTLALFTAVYCNNHHQDLQKTKLAQRKLPVTVPELARYRYCADCRGLLNYALDRRLSCPLEPKPSCRECPHNCYAQLQRDKIRKVMAFSGPYLVKRGRLDLLWRLRFG
jgi:hypothetical protein